MRCVVAAVEATWLLKLRLRIVASLLVEAFVTVAATAAEVEDVVATADGAADAEMFDIVVAEVAA